MVSKVIFFLFRWKQIIFLFLHNKKESLVNDKNKYRKLIFNKIEADQCHLQKVLLLAL